jgi:hypothetical protein
MKNFLICAWILTALSAGGQAENVRIHLLAEVTVQTATLHLSDLLPADATLRLKAAAGKVSLGRAPEAGSLRVFTGGDLREAIAEIPSDAAEIDIPKQVVVQRWGWPVEAEAVRHALSRAGFAHLDFSQARVTLPANFSTAVPDPDLELMTLRPGGDGWLARMRCRERSACASFLVEIAVSGPALVGGTLARPVVGASFRRQLELRPASGPLLVEPGRRALLVIEGDGFRITQPVMPLKRGRLGDLVRVSDPLTRRSLIARVSGKGIVRPDATRKEETK